MENEDKEFEFYLEDQVKIIISGEVGTIKGKVAYSQSENQFLVKYKDANGCAVSGWFYAEELDDLD